MRRYDNYLDSNIEWLGSNPMGWQIKRAKDIFEYINRGTSPDYVEFSDYGVVNQATFSKGFFDISNLRYTSKFNRLSVLKDKDILIASTGGGVLGKTFYVDNLEGNYLADSHVTILRSKEFVNFNKYFYYFFSINYNLINQHLALGSTNQTELQKKYLNNFKLFAPPFSEQQAIANYLDAKTQAIDKKVSLLEQKIETYKKLKRTLINQTITKGLNKNVPLKDSGIAWIGQIPQHWEVKRFKSFADTIKGKNLEVFDNQIEGALPNLSLEYLRNDSVGFEAFVKTNNRNLIVDENDLIIVWDGAGVGEILNGKVGVISSTIAKLKFNKSVNAKFFSFIRYDLEYRLKQIPTGMGIPHLNPHELKNFMCPIPPKSEQEEIAKYLDHKTAIIDAIVGNISKQIETLKQLRKTLINDVVTGKIKVCDD